MNQAICKPWPRTAAQTPSTFSPAATITATKAFSRWSGLLTMISSTMVVVLWWLSTAKSMARSQTLLTTVLFTTKWTYWRAPLIWLEMVSLHSLQPCGLTWHLKPLIQVSTRLWLAFTFQTHGTSRYNSQQASVLRSTPFLMDLSVEVAQSRKQRQTEQLTTKNGANF